MVNWAIQPGEEDESTWLMVGEFSSMRIRGAADLAVTEWNVTVSETERWVDHIWKRFNLKLGRNRTTIYTPDTHDEYFESLDRNWAILEDICELKEATAIASCAFREYDDRSIRRASDLVEAGIFATWHVQRSTSGTHDDV
jgi:hypothetical protein